MPMMYVKCLDNVRSVMLELNSMVALCQYHLYNVSIYFYTYLPTFIVACIR